MMRATSLLFLGIAIASGPAYAAEVDLSKLPPPSDKTGITYEKDIKPIFEASCIRCHGEERPRAGLRLDSLESVLKGGEDGKVVVQGHSRESMLVIAVSRLDEEIAMPPQGGGGRRGGGGGGRGFAAGNTLGPQVISQGDKNKDKAISKDEMAALAEDWFTKIDKEKAGKVNQDKFVEGMTAVISLGRQGPQRQAAAGQPPQEGFNPGRFAGPSLFRGADVNKDGSLTREEFTSSLAKWYAEWDKEGTNALNEDKLRAGFNAALPPANFGFRGGRGGFGGPPPMPLTPEQIGLVRAWIDQGAK